MGGKASLKMLKSKSGIAHTPGLPDDIIDQFLQTDPNLQKAIDLAGEEYERLSEQEKEWLKRPEKEVLTSVQEGVLNFYPADGVSPYLALAAKGSWIISAYGAVIYDTGGYGMMGFGHAPDFVTDSLNRHVVMANVMTPSFAHRAFVDCIRSRIGISKGKCPFTHFVCMNSGSEAVSVATRISDINARKMTDPDGKHAGKKIRFLSFVKGFHGRTFRPATASDSTRARYQALASFRDNEFTWTVQPNDTKALKEAFARAEKEGVFFEAVIIEPVMGEGNPGLMLSPEFYKTARKLTKEHGCFLIIDSIQAGLRAHGVLSIVDYPGFEDCEAPDMETYSKALNAGQYPVSVLALTSRAADEYLPGVYGNTMTANPRACMLSVEVLNQVTLEVQNNIRERGRELFELFTDIKNRNPELVKSVQGTGLLLSIELIDDIKVYGKDSVEEHLRRHGLNVIHGGKNALRFTPTFLLTSREAQLIASETERAIKEFGCYSMAS